MHPTLAAMDNTRRVHSPVRTKTSFATNRAMTAVKNIPEDDNDPLQCIKDIIKWKDDVGYLPGSVCRFKLDVNGELLLADDFEEGPAKKKQKLVTENISNENFLGEVPELVMCNNCNKYGFKQDFLKNNKYCKDCANISPVYFKMFKNLSLLYDCKVTDSMCPEALAQVATAPSHKEQSNEAFKWDTYLEKNNYIAIPSKSFLPSQLLPTRPNRFQVGMKLEGVDPYHPSRICVLTVAEVQGFRLRLHFDGFKKKYDFWVNANHDFIFPAGFCKSTQRKLEPPRGMTSDAFDWKSYLAETNSRTAPSDYFAMSKEDPETLQMLTSLGFNTSMRLEAVDKANNALICVASIRDILNEYLLIHFDGWDDSYDYWAHYTSPLIRPINWCKSKGRALTAPKDYKIDNFSWDDYLNETDSTAVPPRAFKPKAANNFKSGMRLEAVDALNPDLIRVASICGRMGHTVKIHFDGWEDIYDFWIDDDSPNLHPINWCFHTGHPLQTPNSESKLKKCPTSNCTGLGHKKWYNHKTHKKVEDCPYTDENIDFEPPDRFENSESDSEDNEESDVEEEGGNVERETEREDEEIDEPKQIASSGTCNEEKTEPFVDSFSNITYQTIQEEHRMIASKLAPNYIQNCKQLMNHEDSLARMEPNEVMTWDYKRVEQLVRRLTDCPETGRIFSDQCIDGESLLMLQQEDLTDRLHIKLGPAAKIFSIIVALRLALLESQ